MKMTKEQVMDAINQLADIHYNNGYSKRKSIELASIQVEKLIRSLTHGNIGVLEILNK